MTNWTTQSNKNSTSFSGLNKVSTVWNKDLASSEKFLLIGEGFFLSIGEDFNLLADVNESISWVSTPKN